MLLIKWKNCKRPTWEPENIMRESINDDVTKYFKKKEIACTKSSNKCCYPGCMFNFPAENCNTKDCKGMLQQIRQNEYDKKIS